MIRSSALTDIGLKRENNQDFVFVSNLGVGRLDSLFVVADGMGGHNGGGTASDVAVETMLSRIRESSFESARISAFVSPASLKGLLTISSSTAFNPGL